MFDFLKTKKKDSNAEDGKSITETAANAVSGVVGAVTDNLSPTNGRYTVKAGDSLSKIAKRHNITLKQIIAANPQIKNPDLIHPEDVINLG